MKKVLFAAALAAGLCANADVVSSSCVGYNTKTIEADTFYMVAAQFQNVGEDSVAGFNDVLSMNGVAASTYDDMFTSGAEIQVLNGTTYKFYYYISDAVDAEDNPVEGNVWADDGGYVVTDLDDLALGDGFWFHVRGTSMVVAGASITVAGEVSEANSSSKDVIGNNSAGGYFNMIASPFPLATDLATVTTTGLTASTYDDMFTSGNEIQVLDGTTYKFYYYINDAVDSSDNPVDGDVWADDGGYVVTSADKIPVGQSFWIRGRQTGKLTFTK